MKLGHYGCIAQCVRASSSRICHPQRRRDRQLSCLSRVWAPVDDDLTSMRSANDFLAVFILVIAGVGCRAACPSAGCPATHRPVCGEDGVTYMNSCVADCQGVAVVDSSRCSQNNGLNLDLLVKFQDNDVQQGVVSMDTISRYRQEGYKFAGPSYRSAFVPDDMVFQMQQSDDSDSSDSSSNSSSSNSTNTNNGSRSTYSVFYDTSLSEPGRQFIQPRTLSFNQAIIMHSDGSIYYQNIDAVRDAVNVIEKLKNLQSNSADNRATSPPPQNPPAPQQPTGTAAAADGALHISGPPAPPKPQLAGQPVAKLQAKPQARPQPKPQAKAAGKPPAKALPQQPQAGKLQSKAQQPTAAAQAAGQKGKPPVQPKAAARKGSGNALLDQLFAAMRQPSGRRLMHVIGRDNRQEVADDRFDWPYTAVGHLRHQLGVCTGVMVSARAVLTAAHCVYSRKRRAWQENLIFIPGRHRVNGTYVEPFGRIPYESVVTYSGFVQNNNDKDALNYDLAVIKLKDTNIGYKTGWLGLAWDKGGYKGSVTTAGYAGEKPTGSLWISRCQVDYKNGTSSRFTYNCATSPGMSGSPVWEARRDGAFVIRAVNTYESCWCCSKDCKCCNQFFNGGTGITALHYNSVLSWR